MRFTGLSLSVHIVRILHNYGENATPGSVRVHNIFQSIPLKR